MERKPALLGTLLNIVPAFLALLVPIFFLPFTTEFFEFNKLALVTVATVLMVLLWVVKMFYDKKVEIARSPVDLPVLALFTVTLLSTIFSLHKVSSIFGSQGRWFPSLFGVTVFLVLYYVVATNISNLKAIKTAVNAFVVGVTLSSLVAILGYFGVSLGSATYLQIPNFTLTGSTVVAAVLAALGVSLSLTKVLSNANQSLKMLFVSALGINFLAIALMGSLPSWVALVVGLLVVAYFTAGERWVANRSYLGVAGIVVGAILAIMLVPTSRAALENPNYPAELRLSARESWLVVSSTVRDFPLLGTGPSSFGLNYTRYKPLSVNAENYWNVRFDKPFSEAFAIIGALGIVGIAVALSFGMKTLRYALMTKRQMANNATTTALAVGFISMLVVMLVTYATVTTTFVLVFFLALITAKSHLESDGGASLVRLSVSSFIGGSSDMSLVSGEREVFQYVISLPLVALAVVGGYFFSRQYMGEYYMRQAISAAQENNGSLTYQLQQKAIQVNPQRDVYHNSYANTNLALANTLASQDEVTDEQRTTIQALIAQSIRSSRVTTELLSPLNSANWETRAGIYRALVGVADDADEWAVRSYNTAIQLDPANPRLRLNLGGIYYAAGDFLSAANLFNQAASLKSDYANAHYNLAQALVQLNRLPQAQTELEAAQRLVAPGTPDYDRVAGEIAALEEALANVAGATDQPTVGELEQPTPPPAPAPQEPITNVGEEETIEGGNELETSDVTPDVPDDAPEETTP